MPKRKQHRADRVVFFGSHDGESPLDLLSFLGGGLSYYYVKEFLAFLLCKSKLEEL